MTDDAASPAIDAIETPEPLAPGESALTPFEMWLVYEGYRRGLKKPLPRTKGDISAAKLLGVTNDTITNCAKRKTMSRQLALACAAISAGLEPWKG